MLPVLHSGSSGDHHPNKTHVYGVWAFASWKACCFLHPCIPILHRCWRGTKCESTPLCWQKCSQTDLLFCSYCENFFCLTQLCQQYDLTATTILFLEGQIWQLCVWNIIFHQLQLTEHWPPYRCRGLLDALLYTIGLCCGGIAVINNSWALWLMIGCEFCQEVLCCWWASLSRSLGHFELGKWPESWMY